MELEPRHLVTVSEDRTFTFHPKVLEELLSQEHLKDLDVVVYSVAGEYRKGKSFLLSFFLKYLKSEKKKNWVGHENELVENKGFRFQSGIEGHTKGILIWPEVFVMDRPGQEKVAVLLMDTQGTSDPRSTTGVDAKIFALSILFSSVQIYNIPSGIINGANLENLQLYATYARVALQGDTNKKPFQNLKFLVRDWINTEEYSYGNSVGIEEKREKKEGDKEGHQQLKGGGNEYLENLMKVKPNETEELTEVRNNIYNCFTDCSCYLMPFPGTAVWKPNGKLTIGDIDPTFREHLDLFTRSLFQPDKLVPKWNGAGQTMKVHQFIEHCKAIVPKVKQMRDVQPQYNTNMVHSNLEALLQGQQMYREKMKEKCGPGKPYLWSGEFLEEHNYAKKAAMDAFKNATKYGESKFIETFANDLNLYIEDEFTGKKRDNGDKSRIRRLLSDAYNSLRNFYDKVIFALKSGQERIKWLINLIVWLCKYSFTVAESTITALSPLIATVLQQLSPKDVEYIKSQVQKLVSGNPGITTAVDIADKIYKVVMEQSCAKAPSEEEVTGALKRIADSVDNVKEFTSALEQITPETAKAALKLLTTRVQEMASSMSNGDKKDEYR